MASTAAGTAHTSSGGTRDPACRGCTRGAHLPTTVSTSFSMSARMYIRPRRSVWSVPHRLGTFITQRLCTFIIQAVSREKETLSTPVTTAEGHGAFRGDGAGKNLSSFQMGMFVRDSEINTQ